MCGACICAYVLVSLYACIFVYVYMCRCISGHVCVSSVYFCIIFIHVACFSMYWFNVQITYLCHVYTSMFSVYDL